MFTPGIDQIADCLDTTPQIVVGATTGFVVFLGLGPLILAPLSETFGRRTLYIVVRLLSGCCDPPLPSLVLTALSVSRFSLSFKYQRH